MLLPMSNGLGISGKEAAGLLRFYAEAGVIDLLDSDPVDRYVQTVELQKSRRGQTSLATNVDQQKSANARSTPPSFNAPKQIPPPMTAMAVPDQAMIDDAKVLAKSAKSIDDLRETVKQYSGCSLKQSAKNTVFCDGNPEAPIMLIGEAPGRDEDQQGIPFVGRAGQLLDKMLAAIDLDRKGCYITNVIPWRPPGNRTPTSHEIELCRPFVERHIELINPQLLVFMGNVSNKTLLNTNKGILSMRGTWSDYELGENKVPAMSTLHPAYLLRNPIAKRNSWYDLLAIKAKLNEL